MSSTHSMRAVLSALCLAGLGVGAVWLLADDGAAAASVDGTSIDTDQVAQVDEPAFTTVQPQRQDLTVGHDAEGSLVAATTQSVGSPVDGTVVWAVDAGTVVGPGDVLAVVDDQPVTIIEGEVPMWRSLSVGDEGPDVAQLETALVASGFDPTGNVTVDEEYTSATAAMVADWQASIDADDSGAVGRHDIVVLNESMTVSSVGVVPGNTVGEGTELLTLASVEQVVTASVPVADAVTLAVGDHVELQLPDRSIIDGIVQASTLGTDTSVRDIRIEVADQTVGEVSTFGGVTVDISWEQTVATGVLTIPADTLRHLDDGSYVIDVLAADGSVSSVTVEPGQVISNVVVADVPADADVIRP